MDTYIHSKNVTQLRFTGTAFIHRFLVVYAIQSTKKNEFIVSTTTITYKNVFFQGITLKQTLAE